MYKSERDKKIWSDSIDVSDEVSIVISVHQYDGGVPKLRIGRLLNNYGKVQSHQPVKLGGVTLDELEKISELIEMGKTVLKIVAKPLTEALGMLELKGDNIEPIDLDKKIKEALTKKYGASNWRAIKYKQKETDIKLEV